MIFQEEMQVKTSYFMNGNSPESGSWLYEVFLPSC